MNQSIHTIVLLQWMMGPVVEVSACTALLAHERIEVEDTAVAIVRFANGALGLIEGTTAAYPGLTTRLEVHGDRGSAIIDNDELVYFHSAESGEAEVAYGASGGGNPASDMLSQYAGDQAGTGAGSDPASLLMAHRGQIHDFINAIREDREPMVNIEEGRKPVAIILAIYESARRAVRFVDGTAHPPPAGPRAARSRYRGQQPIDGGMFALLHLVVLLRYGKYIGLHRS